jgi:hypothetical protein
LSEPRWGCRAFQQPASFKGHGCVGRVASTFARQSAFLPSLISLYGALRIFVVNRIQGINPFKMRESQKGWQKSKGKEKTFGGKREGKDIASG